MKPLSSMPVLLILTAAAAGAQTAPAPSTAALLVKGLPWRSIGPAVMGGRVDEFAVVEKDPATIYVATAAGGIFKTTNAGTTWDAVFDSAGSLTIGSVAVAPSDPNVVWAGTGEANNRQSSSWGDGVYRSTDAGKTWNNVGLHDTSSIGEIAIDPRDPNVVYVAAVGNLWKANPERGLYKTADAGKTWQRVLYVDDDTGVTDVKLDPQHPDTLYAAAYQRRRTPYGFNGGGPGSGIYKSTDAGAHWTKLTNGLPTGDKGRIGLAVYGRVPRIVYSIVEDKPGSIYSTTGVGGVYRSEDAGESWTKMSDLDPRPTYYSHVFIDPTNDKKLWVLGVNLHYSENGGKTWVARPTSKIHSDFHAFWIDPANPNHFLAGCDGGLWWTYDNGKNWDYLNNLPLAQYYEVAYDMRRPYWVYGGLQDNFSWGGPSATLAAEGPANEDWVDIGGGDGFYNMVDWSDDDVVYQESQNGGITRLNMATRERKFIKPRAPAGEPEYRFDWNTPMLMSPHDPKTIYLGGNRLFISHDRGDSWERTDDLSTKPDRKQLAIFGVKPPTKLLSEDDGQDSFGQIITISESPRKAGLIYVGTDDGNLQMSRDGGKTWTNVASNVPGMPRGTYVARLVASRYADGRCYACFDGHRSGDFKPYLYVTEDYGASWQPLAAGIPDGSTLHVVREHQHNPDLLFAGTERGAYVSLDRGASWTMLPAPLPAVPVDDIQIHRRDNDLILGTHGRGIWILDDITPFEQMAGRSAGSETEPAVLFAPRTTYAYRIQSKFGFTGNREFIAPNPPTGAILQFYLPHEPAASDDLKLSVLDRTGRQLIANIRGIVAHAGLNRVTWDLRYNASEPASPPPAANRPGGGRRRGMGLGPRVLPGTYTVQLTVGKATLTQPLRVEDDPRVRASIADRRAQFGLVIRLVDLRSTGDHVRLDLADLRGQIKEALAAKEAEQAPAADREALNALLKRIARLDAEITAPSTTRGAGSDEMDPEAVERGETDVTDDAWDRDQVAANGDAGASTLAMPHGETDGLAGGRTLRRAEREADGQEPASRPGQTPAASAAGQGAGQAAAAVQATAAGAPATPSFTPLSDRIQRLMFSEESLTEAPSAFARHETDDIAAHMREVVRELGRIEQQDIPALNRRLAADRLKPLKPPAPAPAPR